jgi:hypothetical protein
MADLMQDAASFLADELADNLSQTVTYTRGGQTVSLAATKCPIRSESDGQYNQDFEGCDWIVKASLLTLGEPQPVKDVIEEADGQKWEVLDMPNDPCFRPFDPFRTAFRIHTKRIKEAD